MHVEIHESRKNGKFLGRIEFECGLFKANLWLCFSDFYEGYAVTKAREKWVMLTDYMPFPNSVEEFSECQNLVAPKKILVTVDTSYPDILEMDFGDDEIPFKFDDLMDDPLEINDEPLPF